MLDPSKQLRVVVALFGIILILAVFAALGSSAGSGTIVRADSPVTIVVKPSPATARIGLPTKIYVAGFLGADAGRTIDPSQAGELTWRWSVEGAAGGTIKLNHIETDESPNASITAQFDKAGSYTFVVRCEITDKSSDGPARIRSGSKEVTVIVTPTGAI